MSLDDLKGAFEWIKEDLGAGALLRRDRLERERQGSSAVRDLVSLLTCFSIGAYPNEWRRAPRRGLREEVQGARCLLGRIFELNDGDALQEASSHHDGHLGPARYHPGPSSPRSTSGTGGKARSLKIMETKPQERGAVLLPFHRRPVQSDHLRLALSIRSSRHSAGWSRRTERGATAGAVASATCSSAGGRLPPSSCKPRAQQGA